MKLPHNISDLELPEYSKELVDLSRMYDAACLVSCSAGWFCDAMANDGYVDETGYPSAPDSLPSNLEQVEEFSEWTEGRIRNMNGCLDDLRTIVHKMIIKESSQYFDVDELGLTIQLPDEVNACLGVYLGDSSKVYLKKESDRTADSLSSHSNEFNIILWDDEVWKIPKFINKSFVEVWWRRQYINKLYHLPNQPMDYYQLFLKRNEQYGWDCYGHER